MKTPNFFCLGASKSGTTSIYKVLGSHPEVYNSSFKEPHFFDNEQNYNKGLNWYINNFYKKIKNQKIISDFTPTYLYDKNAPLRIKETLGEDLKFVIIIRDPVERSYSHYLHSKRDNIEKKDFLEALDMEKDRLKNADFLSTMNYSYIAQSKYFEMIKRYLNYFPRKNFKIYIFEEDFKNKNSIFFECLFSFLGLKKNKIQNTNVKINVASKPRLMIVKKILSSRGSFLVTFFKFLIPSILLRRKIRNTIQALNNKPIKKDSLDKRVKKIIFEKYFKQDVNSLEELLDRDLSFWKDF